MTAKPFSDDPMLSDIPAADLARYSRKLVSINAKTTLDEALEILHQQNILSVPVRDEEKDEWVGILTIQDILFYIAFKDFKDGKLSESFDNGKRAAGEIILERDNNLPIAAVSDSVADVLEPLCKGYHRMMVRLPHYPSATVEEKEAELRLVTQSDVIKSALLLKNVAEWNKTLHDLDLIQGEVHSIQSNETAVTGFRRMGVKDLSALAVVSDTDGKLLSTLSASDLRGLTSNVIHRIAMPVTEFLKEHNHGHLSRPVTVTPEATLSQAVNNMMWGRVHRVWVVDQASKPIGVVTSTDVIKHLFNMHLATL